MAGRILTVGVAVIGVAIGSWSLKTGGEAIVERSPTIGVATQDAGSALDFSVDDENLALEAVEPEPGTDAPQAVNTKPEPDLEPTGQGGYERIEPRAPLSDLALAAPPKPKPTPMPDSWKYTRLFNPVATAAGLIEAQGHRLAIAGVQPLPPEQSCTFEGKPWPCGARARTAFRAWLRARAVQCKVPPVADREIITVGCQIGKEDVAEWLVASGWAKAVEGGPYADKGKLAAQDRKGIFGPPPKRVAVTWQSLAEGLPRLDASDAAASSGSLTGQTVLDETPE